MTTRSDKTPKWLIALGAVASAFGGVAVALMLADMLSPAYHCPRCGAEIRKGQNRCPHRNCRVSLRWE